MSARSVGVAVGLVVSGLSIAGNLWRGDPHLVTTVPDVFTALVMAAVICLGLYRVATQEQVAVGASQGVIRAASVVFAVCLGTFTLIYLPSHSLLIAGFAALSGFVLVFVLGFAANLVARRIARRAWS